MMGAGFWASAKPTRTTSFTPTLSSSTNVSANAGKWRRSGPLWIAEGIINWSGAGGAGAFTLQLPVVGSQLAIDTDELAGGNSTTNAGSSLLGVCEWFVNGAGWKPAFARYASASTVKFADNTQIIDGSQFANGDGFKYVLCIPIVGWT